MSFIFFRIINYFYSDSYEEIIGEENYENNSSNLIYLKAIDFLCLNDDDFFGYWLRLWRTVV